MCARACVCVRVCVRVLVWLCLCVCACLCGCACVCIVADSAHIRASSLISHRASFITETDEVELENALRERVQEEVKYDFFIDTPKPNSVRRVSSVLSGFDSIFDRK